MAASVMGRPEEENLHQLAKHVAFKIVPDLDEHLATPNNTVVAIERHDCDWRDGCMPTERRFLWIRAESTNTLKFQAVEKYYRAHYEHTDIPLTFSIDGQFPSHHTRLTDLDKHHDGFIVFSTQGPAAGPGLPLTASSPFALGSIPTSYASNSNLSTARTSWDIDELSEPKLPQDNTPKDCQDLMNLPPTTSNQAIFMQENDYSDPPDQATRKAMASAADEYHAQYQSSRPRSGPPPSRPASRNALDRSSHNDHSQPEIVAEATESLLTGADHVPCPTENVLAKDELPESQSTVKASLQLLLQEKCPERLEAAVTKGNTVLSWIEAQLYSVSQNAEAQKWQEQIETVRKTVKKNRTVIGVVGNTGAGKSSVINAVLDEERLVPTNCMRACTAVVTEMSYNDSQDMSARYRAEIEFIQPEDWRRELTVLFEEVFDNAGGVAKDAHNADSIAGVAYAKIRAVYHKHTKDMLQKSTVDQLMNVPSLKGILGSIKRIKSRDCANFYQHLQHYVDSQQQSSGSKSGQARRVMQLWPLIKVVRIYTKAEALSTGAVIVDLPGVHDSNAARAAVAEGYIKECTSLWIVAPITRAVDDKAAKNLLGNTFKRQLKYDGSYSAVTFICSKTDDISTTEAAESLQLVSALAELEDKRKAIDREKRTLEDEKQQIEDEKENQDHLMMQHDDHITEWEDLLSRVEGGEIMPAPHSLTRKRKRVIDVDDDSAELSDDQPLTVEQAQSKIDELKRLKKAARQSGLKLRDELQTLLMKLNELEARTTDINDANEAMCIEGRNEWSRGRIRDDFAEGIKELDQENAAEESPDDFDPDEEIRDYEEVARSLPVFCVSSRAFQKLSGRLQKDSHINGFTSVNQTEIPQLQAHCRKLTEAGRQESCKSFLNSLSQLLTSLTLWTSDDASGPEPSSQERKALEAFVAKNTQFLGGALHNAVTNVMNDVEDTLESQLFDQLASAAHTAGAKALPTSTVWGAPREIGGLFWGTYKATVRRYGVFHGASGSRDFNAELAAPLHKRLAKYWERAFHRRLPEVLNSFPETTNLMIRDFHDVIEQRCTEQNLQLTSITHLRSNLAVIETTFIDLVKQTIMQVNEAQREINREFNPSIATTMAFAYYQCTNENGKGSFARMKTIMHNHVSANQNTMFETATNGIKQSLNTMCNQFRTRMTARVGRIFQNISRDYQAAVGTNINKDRTMGRPEKVVQKKVEDMIAQSEALFCEVLNCPLEELKSIIGLEAANADTGVIDDGSEAEVEDVTEPLVVLSSEGIEEDDVVES